MSWEREMDDAIAARTLEHIDTALPAEPTGMTGIMKGSITFSADKSAPCHCANCVVLEQDVARLRVGNAAVIHDNQRLQHELAAANARINELENQQFVGRL